MKRLSSENSPNGTRDEMSAIFFIVSSLYGLFFGPSNWIWPLTFFFIKPAAAAARPDGLKLLLTSLSTNAFSKVEA